MSSYHYAQLYNSFNVRHVEPKSSYVQVTDPYTLSMTQATTCLGLVEGNASAGSLPATGEPSGASVRAFG